GSVFLVNVPVVVVALVLGQLFVPTSRDPAAPPIRVPGALLSIAGLVVLVWAIIEGPGGWTDPEILGAFALAAVLLGTFILWERWTRFPMPHVGFFRNPRFRPASGAIMLTFFAMFGSLFLLTQFLQSILGYTPLEAGIRLLPMAGVMIVLSPLSAKVVERIGSKIVVAAGLSIAALGLVIGRPPVAADGGRDDRPLPAQRQGGRADRLEDRCGVGAVHRGHRPDHRQPADSRVQLFRGAGIACGAGGRPGACDRAGH